MSSPTGPDFSRMMPGMDFLQNLMTGAAAARSPGAGAAMPPWLLPTLDLDELDKRIQDLKTVQFWLEQNSRLLATTIQTLEVQRMTVATLKGLNVTAQDLMQGWTQAPDAAPATPLEPAATASRTTAAPPSADAAPPATDTSAAEAVGAGVQQAMQWWQQVHQQFGQLAATVATAPAADGAPSVAGPGPDTAEASSDEAPPPVRKRARGTATQSPADKA